MTTPKYVDHWKADTATFEARMAELDRLEVADEGTAERVARAIAEAQGCGRTATPLTRRLARAAIDALKPAPGTDSSGQVVVDVLRGGEHVATLDAVYGSVSVDSSGQADEELTETVLAVFADWDARDARQREEDSGQAVQRVLDLADRHERSAKHRRRLAERWMDAERYQLADAFRRLARQSETESARIRAAVAGPQRDHDEEGGQ